MARAALLQNRRLVSDPGALIRFHRQLLTALERGDRARAKALCTRYFTESYRRTEELDPLVQIKQTTSSSGP